MRVWRGPRASRAGAPPPLAPTTAPPTRAAWARVSPPRRNARRTPRALALGHLLRHGGPCLARFLDRALVLDGRDVARILAERHGFQHSAHDLSAACLRQHVDEVELSDHRDRTELAPHRRVQLLAQRLG